LANLFLNIRIKESLILQLQSGKNQSLKSRRNKKFVCGNSLYSAYISENCQNIEPLQQILRIVTDESIALSSDVIQYFIADCALHLLAQKYDLSFKHEKALLSRFLKKEITLSLYDELIYALIADSEQALLFCEKYSPLFDFDYVYEPAEDILGLIYISCKNIDSRKATGSYYTPTKIVKKLIEKLDIASDARILDPCCGTGNFLLQLPAHVRFDQIYGNDTDTISVKITRLNMVLKYDILSVKTLYEHITEADYLASDSKTSYQYIIGNPPWGYEFSESEKEKLRKNYRTASGKNIESYDLFIEKAVDDIYESGSTAPFIFNDGARGYFNRLLDNSNFDTTTAYKGRFDNYINELPSINLAKIHGSVNWKKQSEDMIRVCNYVVRDKPEKRETVKPDGNEPKATTLKKHYYEMLRFFEYEMSESAENIGNGSLLIVHGFSFGDKHIVHALKRALENRELLVIIVAYTDNDVEVIKRNLKDLAERKNLRFLCPKDFSFHGEEFSRLDLNNFNKIIAGKLKCA